MPLLPEEEVPQLLVPSGTTTTFNKWCHFCFAEVLPLMLVQSSATTTFPKWCYFYPPKVVPLPPGNATASCWNPCLSSPCPAIPTVLGSSRFQVHIRRAALFADTDISYLYIIHNRLEQLEHTSPCAVHVLFTHVTRSDIKAPVDSSKL